ncbi:MAG TPA: substrate-binding domain-containing protein [Kofleriaceae bacterium]|nr:substrate-binding domain-containing protein [Kofleriaceae bacterium]
MKLAVACAIALLACGCDRREPQRSAPVTIRVAVIGGMVETGFWRELAGRYELTTGNKIEIVASGPKQVVIDAFRKGGVDVITMHTSDAMIDLVAEGLAVDPQPWLENDMLIVGPTDDPAQIKGEHDAAAAVAKLVAAQAPILVDASLGADGVLHDLADTAHIALDPTATVMFDGKNQHALMSRAAALHAYTLVGRIPYLDGKLHADGIDVMVRGDRRLRRAFLVETATDAPPAARDLAEFLRAPETQAWIGTFGKGRFDDQPLFYPVTPSNRATASTH